MTADTVTSLISADNSFALLAVFFAIAVIATTLEKTRLGKRVSGVIFVIAIAMGLSSVGVIPASAPTYAVIWSLLVPMAIALFLVRADLVSIVFEGGRTLIVFGFGVVGVMVGAWLGALLLDLGMYEADYAGVFSATYVGGSLNFVAVAEAVGFHDASALAAGVAIDNVVGLGYVIFAGAMAGNLFFQKHFSWRADQLHISNDEVAGEARAPTMLDFSVSLGLAALACAAGDALAKVFGQPGYAILYVTAMMVAIATLGRHWLKDVVGPELLAMLFMYLFFAMLGAGADLSALLTAGPALFAYVLIIFAVHILFVLIGARLFRLNYAEIVIASTACIGGPPISAAFAVLFGWKRLAVPAVAIGVLGYVLGNFVGIGMFEWLSK